MTLADRALLVDLKLHSWAGTKTDKEVSATAAEAYDAELRVGSYTKKLLPPEAFKDINRIWNIIYNEHQRRSLPWADSGLRVLSADGWFEYNQTMRRLKTDWESAVDSFCDNYKDWIKSYEPELNKMFHKEDYPSVEQVKAKFGFDFRIMPVPQGDDFRVEVEGKSDIQKEIDAQTVQATSAAMQEVAKRITDAMTHMVDVLGKTDTKSNALKDSLVDNLRTMAKLLPGLNLANDPLITEVADAIERRICTVEGSALRKSADARDKARTEAEDILEKMKGFYA